jgi:hypothetical protein
MLGAADRCSSSELRTRHFCFRRPRCQLEGKEVYEAEPTARSAASPEHSTARVGQVAGSAGIWPWTPVRGLFSVARSRRI